MESFIANNSTLNSSAVGAKQKYKRMKNTYLILGILTMLFCSSCFFNDECDGITTEQKFKFADFEVNVDRTSDSLAIGDSIIVELSVPAMVFDSVENKEVEIEKGIDVVFAVTRHSSYRFDTSLVDVFEEWFDLEIVKGKRLDNDYRFEMEREGAEFKAHLIYVPKKALSYSIGFQFTKIDMDLSDNELNCMDGDTDSWNSRLKVRTDFNQIEEILPDADQIASTFGFIVSE